VARACRAGRRATLKHRPDAALQTSSNPVCHCFVVALAASQAVPAPAGRAQPRTDHQLVLGGARGVARRLQPADQHPTRLGVRRVGEAAAQHHLGPCQPHRPGLVHQAALDVQPRLAADRHRQLPAGQRRPARPQLLGGAVTQGASWQFIFWLNVPVGLVVIPLAARMLAESRGSATRLDTVGLGLVSTGLFAVVWGLVRGNEHGWSSPGELTALLGGALLVGAFIGWERRTPQPMLPLGLFRSRAFSAVNVAALLMSVGMFGSIFLLAQFLQTVQGYGPLGAGLRTLPWTAVPVLVAPLAGPLSDRIGGKPLLVAGLVLQGLGIGWLGLELTVSTSYAHLLAPFVLSRPASCFRGVGNEQPTPDLPVPDRPPGKTGKRADRQGSGGEDEQERRARARRGPSGPFRTGKGPADTGKGPGSLTAASGKGSTRVGAQRGKHLLLGARHAEHPLAHTTVAVSTEVSTGPRALRPDGLTKAEHWSSSSLPSRLNREWALLCNTAPDRRAVHDWAAPSRDRAALAALVCVDGLHTAVRLPQRRGRANNRVADDPAPPGVAGPHSGLEGPEPHPASPSQLPGRAARKPAPPTQPRSAPASGQAAP